MTDDVSQAIKYIKNTYGKAIYTSDTVATSGWLDAYKNYVSVSNTSGTSTISPYVTGGNLSVAWPTTITLSPDVLKQLMEQIVTEYKEGGPLVICLDSEYTMTQIRELSAVLVDAGIKGVIITGGKAGTGKAIHRDLKEKYQFIDTLARIAMVWEQNPDLNLTDLLKWWHGEDMEDDDFAAAIDVYYNKIFGE